MVEVPVLPDWAKDAVIATAAFRLDWRERLRVLFGALVEVRLMVFCQTPPGRTETESTARVYFKNGVKGDFVASEDAPDLPSVKRAVEMILDERRRQIFVEGWTAEHDDTQHTSTELADAAYSYWHAQGPDTPLPALSWPWETAAWKPKDRVSNLVRAGALYRAAAEQAVRRKEPQEVQLIWDNRSALVVRELSRALNVVPQTEAT